jgi:hypothetical protein
MTPEQTKQLLEKAMDYSLVAASQTANETISQTTWFQNSMAGYVANFRNPDYIAKLSLGCFAFGPT